MPGLVPGIGASPKQALYVDDRRIIYAKTRFANSSTTSAWTERSRCSCIVGLARDKGRRDFAAADFSLQTETRFELDLIVAGRRLQQIELAAFRALRRVPETKTEDDVLVAETFELNIQNVFKYKRHDSVFLQNEVATVIHLVRHIPSVDTKCTLGSPAQAETYNLCIVKARDASEPSQ